MSRGDITDDAEDWRPSYRDLRPRFESVFEAAKSEYDFATKLEPDTFPTGDALTAVDLATIYGIESTYGTDPGAFDAKKPGIFGGFQLSSGVANDYGLAVTNDPASDGRVEWRDKQLDAAKSGDLTPAWHDHADLDLVESAVSPGRLEPVVKVAAKYLFSNLRTCTWTKFGGILAPDGGNLLVVDRDEVRFQPEQESHTAVEIIAEPPGLRFVGLMAARAAEKEGDHLWGEIVLDGGSADRPDADPHVFDALVRRAIASDGFETPSDDEVEAFKRDILIAAVLKSIIEGDQSVPSPLPESVKPDILERWAEEIVGPRLDVLTRYLENALLVVGSQGMRTASAQATPEDLRNLAYAGYNGGWIRLTAARFKAYLHDVAVNGDGDASGLAGYASQWDRVKPFLHDEAREYPEKGTAIRNVLSSEFPPENAKITAVDFESLEETAVIENVGNSTLYLGNWTLADSRGHAVRFEEDIAVEPGDTLEVSFGDGNLLEKTQRRPVLNDRNGDTVRLRDDRDHLVSTFDYRIEHVPRSEEDQSYEVFRNTSDHSNATHWVPWDCGFRPAPANRSEPFVGTPSCYFCQLEARRDVVVTQEWTDQSDWDADEPRLPNESATDQRVDDVEPGEFYDEWLSRS